MTTHQAGCWCSGCCECDASPRPDWIVDLGSGGWVDDCCNSCDQFQGEFTSTVSFGCFSAAFSSTNCSITCTDECNGTASWTHFLLEINTNSGVGESNRCDYFFKINSAFTDPPCSDGLLGSGRGSIEVKYEKLNVVKTDCSGTEWITLTKVSEYNGAFGGSPANKFYCTGTMPATIRVRRDL